MILTQETYHDFLTGKIKLAEKTGFSFDNTQLNFHPSTKPHQYDIAKWALIRGAALIAADCGMGKTHISIEVLKCVHELIGGKHLIVTELGATGTYCDPDPEVGDGARLGIKIDYVTDQSEAFASECPIVVTNYERVRMGRFDFGKFKSVWLDEGNYVKNMASETTSMLQNQLARVRFKFIASATPNPNRTLELVNYAHVLGICDRGQILTRFFQRNSTKAGDLTLHPHHEEDFWMWVYSWMISIERPSDLGYDDEGYALPELEIEWHEVKMNKVLEGKVDRDGQKKMFLEAGADLSDKARIKRESIDVRLAKAMEIINANPEEHFVIWHLLEDERKAIKSALSDHPSYGEIFGSQNWDEREKITSAFIKGHLQLLGTKADLSGVGVNFQHHCHRAIVLSINHDHDAFYQLIKRIHRFGQKHKVKIDVVYVAEEYDIVSDLNEKWRLQDVQRMKIRKLVRKHGLSHSQFVEERKRSFHIQSKTYQGENYTLIHGDSVIEWQKLPDNSIQLYNTSFPFGNHYEYTDKYNDFGHNQDLRSFCRQLDYLLPEMYRALAPGRIAAVHLKNRIHYGSVTGLGFSTFHRFTHAMCDSMESHGFQTMGFHYIPTDVVAENNQTYRLGYGEMKKDSTKMGSGIPEEIWIFRKPPSSNSNAYADVPVTHQEGWITCPYCFHSDKPGTFEKQGSFLFECPKCIHFIQPAEMLGKSNEGYSLAHWQIDADSFWGSSGNRLLMPHELKRWGIDKIQAWWKKFNKETIYDYDKHVDLLRALDEAGKLSRTFTTLPMQSNTPYIWNDVNRMQGLNLEQSRRKQQNHICPQPFDEVDRIIELYSEPADLVGDPFPGLATTGVRALLKGRKFFGSELNEVYAKCGAAYLREAEMKKNIPTLFDMLQQTV
jgi:DNA modification methylase